MPSPSSPPSMTTAFDVPACAHTRRPVAVAQGVFDEVQDLTELPGVSEDRALSFVEETSESGRLELVLPLPAGRA